MLRSAMQCARCNGNAVQSRSPVLWRSPTKGIRSRGPSSLGFPNMVRRSCATATPSARQSVISQLHEACRGEYAKARADVGGYIWGMRMVLFAHVACAIQMVQWYQTDILHIRSLSFLAMTMFICFDAYNRTWVYVVWEIGYNLINGWQIALLLNERKDILLTTMEQVVWDAGLNEVLTKKQLRKLLSVATEKRFVPGDVIANMGEPQAQRVLLIIRGGIAVLGHGTLQLASNGPGDFVGEFHFIEMLHGKNEADETDAVESVTLQVGAEGAVVFEWQDEQLREFLLKDTETANGLEAIWMRHIVRKMAERNEVTPFHTYVHVLDGVLSIGSVAEVALEFLESARELHQITAQQHVEALANLGYTEAEFADMTHQKRQMPVRSGSYIKSYMV